MSEKEITALRDAIYALLEAELDNMLGVLK
jgi:hypothetical protein